jgi:hypothetical protein
MTSQIATMAVGFMAAGLMAHYDYRQARTADCLIGALLTFGLFATVALSASPQA